MRSMTGYGVGAAALGDGRVTVEVRSVNNRFLDVRVRTPDALAEHAFFLEQLLRERQDRGRYELVARLEWTSSATPGVSIERLREAYRALSSLRDELAPGTELSLGTVLGLPDVLSSARALDVDATRSALTSALELALEALGRMRELEGRHLAAALRQSLDVIRGASSELSERARAAPARLRTRLLERLERLRGDSALSLDPGRLEAEVALLASRSDVAEELVRLGSHFDQIELLLSSTEPVGRRLEFLLQEITREANTLSSKSQDSPISHLVVQIKSEVEKLREQVQNVE